MVPASSLALPIEVVPLLCETSSCYQQTLLLNAPGRWTDGRTSPTTYAFFGRFHLLHFVRRISKVLPAALKELRVLVTQASDTCGAKIVVFRLL